MLLTNPTRTIISRKNSLFAKSDSGLFLSPETYSHDWQATNATISIVSDTYVHPLQYAIKVQPIDDVSEIVISLHGIKPIDNDINGSSAQFHCRVLGDKSVYASVKLTDVTSSSFDSYGQYTNSGKWTGIFSPVVELELIDTEQDDIEFDIDISITQHGGQLFYVSVPVLMNEFGFAKNTFIYNMNKFMPSFIWDNDKIQEYPNYPLTKFLHSLTIFGHLSTVLYKRFFHYLNADISVGNEEADFRYSQLVDPVHVDVDYQPWLSQFTGSQLYKSVTSSASTEAILNQENSVTWQLQNAYFGRNAGTLDAIRECAKQVLTGNKTVYVFPGGQFFQINVYTLLSQTPGVTDSGDTSPEVMAMLELTKPMGFVLNHESYASLPFIFDDPVYGALGPVQQNALG